MKKLFISKWTLEKSLYKIRKSIGAHTTLEMLNLLRTDQENIISGLHFSPRGKKVFLLLKEGLTRPQIAERLSMTISGVKRHRENMLRQNGCTSILELIAKYHDPSGMDRESPEGNNE